MERGRLSEIARDAGVSLGYLSQILSGKIYKGMKKARGASWKTCEALALVSDTSPELWARNLAHGTPEKIVAAIEAADDRRRAAAGPAMQSN